MRDVETVAGMFRYIANSDRVTTECDLCREIVDNACESCREWKTKIADMIDAEERAIVEAQRDTSGSTSAHYVMRTWAEDKGKPFRDGESISQWLDRWYLPRPLFEDGEPAQMDDAYKMGSGGAHIEGFMILADGSGYRPVMSFACSMFAIDDRLERLVEPDSFEKLRADANEALDVLERSGNEDAYEKAQGFFDRFCALLEVEGR